jgi:hypothetical protein
VSEEHLSLVEAAMLCISEARERAEAAARALRSEGDVALLSALEDADRRLLELHAELMRAAYLPSSGVAQLPLVASG